MRQIPIIYASIHLNCAHPNQRNISKLFKLSNDSFWNWYPHVHTWMCCMCWAWHWGVISSYLGEGPRLLLWVDISCIARVSMENLALLFLHRHKTQPHCYVVSPSCAALQEAGALIVLFMRDHTAFDPETEITEVSFLSHLTTFQGVLGLTVASWADGG